MALTVQCLEFKPFERNSAAGVTAPWSEQDRKPDGLPYVPSPPIVPELVLRPYQVDVVARFFAAVAAGKKRIIIVAPTGSGKTVILGEIKRQWLETTGASALTIAHRREIVRQTSCKLQLIGIEHGIIQAGEESDEPARVQVASIQTLHSRAIRRKKIELPPAGLVAVDECHHVVACTWKQILDGYRDAVVVGLTATPERGDGRGLGNIFELMLECPQVGELVEQKYLVGTRVYAPYRPDLRGVRTQAGDYLEDQLAARMDLPQLVGDIVTHWHRLAEGRRTVVFATGVQHSVHIRDEFRKSGVSCEHIDGSTPKDERDAILKMLDCGAIDVVTNCLVLTGWDAPAVGCCVLARPTKKMGLYRQMVGRILRAYPGKTDAIVIDHAGAVYQHGFVEDPVIWTLDPDQRTENPTHKSRSEGDIKSRLVDCSQCGALRVGGEPCPHCGFMPAPKPRYVPVIEGDLAQVNRDGGAKKKVYSDAEKQSWWRQLTFIEIKDKRKPRFAACVFRDKFGHWPGGPGVTVSPEPPTPEVNAWVRHRLIAYAKAMQKRRATA
jgi:superfamily II DNA or RNA helicase